MADDQTSLVNQTPTTSPEATPAPGDAVKPPESAPVSSPEAAPGVPPPPTAEEKAAAEAKAKALVSKDNPFKPEELKLPEGFVLNEDASKTFVELVNKHAIPRDAVGDLVKLQADFMKAASEKGETQWNELQTTWQNEVRADPEIGGSKLSQTQSGIGKLLTTYGDDKVRAAFDLTGAGNNPAIVRFLAKMAADLTEPGVRSPPHLPQTEKTAAEVLYPNQGKAA